MALLLFFSLHFLLAGAQYYSEELFNQEKTLSYWHNLGLTDIEEALAKTPNTKTAKNVILFLGDGMGISTVTAGRIFKGQKKSRSGEEGYLTFDRFPNVGLLKTYNVNKQVPDSAGTATAFLCGVKANYYTVGLTASVLQGDCLASLDEDSRAHSILKWAQEAGKETGIVTTTRITHATPAASYAGSAHREWECDAPMKATNDMDVLRCRDIARQLVEDEPGKNLKVIFGGGRQPMGAQFQNSTSSTCKREDGRNLVEEWVDDKRRLGGSAEYVTNTREMEEVDLDETDHLIGLFSESHMSYERDRDTTPSGQPSLKQMTQTAIKRLSRSEDGFVLLVEGGRIDHALHDSKPQISLEEVITFDEAIKAALELVDLSETLVIVTADHSHGLTINGYPDRGNSIIGTTSYEEGTDGSEYTTLLMSNGAGANFSWDGEKVKRSNVTGVDTNQTDYLFQALVHTKLGWSVHSGEDVSVYATGPWSHLFHRVHEQSYVAHVIAYSSEIGPYAENTGRRPRKIPEKKYRSSAPKISSHSYLAIVFVLFIFLDQLILEKY